MTTVKLYQKKTNVPKEHPPKMYQKNTQNVPKNPRECTKNPKCTKKPPGMYQKKPQNVPKKPQNVAEPPPPKCTNPPKNVPKNRQSIPETPPQNVATPQNVSKHPPPPAKGTKKTPVQPPRCTKKNPGGFVVHFGGVFGAVQLGGFWYILRQNRGFFWYKVGFFWCSPHTRYIALWVFDAFTYSKCPSESPILLKKCPRLEVAGGGGGSGPGHKTTPKWGIKPPLKPPRVVLCPLLWGIKPPLLGDKTTPLGGYNHPLWGIKPPPLVKTTPFGGIKPPQGWFYAHQSKHSYLGLSGTGNSAHRVV